MIRKIINRIFSAKFPKFKKYIIYKKNLSENLSHTYDTSKLKIIILKNESDFKKLIDEDYLIKIWDKKLFINFLNNDCIGVCISIDKKLIQARWIATNNKSKKLVDPIPLRVDWKESAIWGNAMTHIHHRGQSLNKISYYECSKLLAAIGKKNVIWTVQAKNFSNHKSYNIFNPKIIGFGYVISLIWFNFRYSRYIKK
jgi:hypothetical protein